MRLFFEEKWFRKYKLFLLKYACMVIGEIIVHRNRGQSFKRRKVDFHTLEKGKLACMPLFLIQSPTVVLCCFFALFAVLFF